ncbi:hypothetical protein PSP31121_01561 [Pandoraea sputorum]|uniref:Uncharacterized protein n=1 Tax=Pandoraea sputorum TaxID=93222 RepID=A0A5E5AYU8_9BURK|nr:hypothetical protein PSP31121_01561 [Pandoraea sputorum]
MIRQGERGAVATNARLWRDANSQHSFAVRIRAPDMIVDIILARASCH